MDDLGARAKLGDGIGNPIIEARTHGQDHIAVMHGHVSLVKTVHTEHAQELAVGARIGTQPHKRIGNRVIQLARQCRE